MLFDEWFARHQTVSGWLAVFGGFLVHLSYGTIYSIGNMAPYFTSYIRAYSTPENLNYATSTWVFASAIVGQGSCMFIGGLINKKIGPRWTTLIGGMLMSVGTLLCYFTIKVSFYVLLLTYGLMFGAGIGISYAPPLACGMKWLPNHKGLVNGIVVAGFGGGAFIFNQVQTAFINPDNKEPDQTVPESSDKYFSKENASDVLERVPSCFLLMGGCYVVMQIVGAILIKDPPEPTSVEVNDHTALIADNDDQDSPVLEFPPEQSDVDEVEDVHPLDVIKTRAFYTLWFMFLVNGQGVVFISTLYKAYGLTFIDDDHFIAIVGSFASVFNSVGRICWGHLADRFSFRTAMLCMCTSMIVWLLTLIATPYGGKAMFFIWICAIFGTFSGNFALFPTATAKSFGQKYMPVNFGLVFTSQVVTGPIGAFLAQSLLHVIDWSGMFFLVAGFTFAGWLLAFSFNVKNASGKDI